MSDNTTTPNASIKPDCIYVVWCADDMTDNRYAWNAKVCKTENEALAVRGFYAAQHPNNRYFITRGF